MATSPPTFSSAIPALHRIFSLVALVLSCHTMIFAATSSEDRIVVYDMKEDPSIGLFIANLSIKGFYGLEIDEEKGEAAILYRVEDILYRADVDLKVKGSQLILKNGRRRKTFIREESTLPSGATQEVVYPVECPPAKSGWLHGASFGKHVIARNDEMGERLLVGSAHLEFKIAMQRCSGPQGDCGPIGCPEMGVIATSSSTNAGVRLSTGPLPLAQALLDGKLNAQAMLTTYKADINAVLPQKLSDLAAITTSYRTTGLPYPGFSDPFIEQRGFKNRSFGQKLRHRSKAGRDRRGSRTIAGGISRSVDDQVRDMGNRSEQNHLRFERTCGHVHANTGNGQCARLFRYLCLRQERLNCCAHGKLSLQRRAHSLFRCASFGANGARGGRQEISYETNYLGWVRRMFGGHCSI